VCRETTTLYVITTLTSRFYVLYKYGTGRDDGENALNWFNACARILGLGGLDVYVNWFRRGFAGWKFLLSFKCILSTRIACGIFVKAYLGKVGALGFRTRAMGNAIMTAFRCHMACNYDP